MKRTLFLFSFIYITHSSIAEISGYNGKAIWWK